LFLPNFDENVKHFSRYDQTIPEEEISQELRNSLNSIRLESTPTHRDRPMLRANSSQLSSKSLRSSDSLDKTKHNRKGYSSLYNQRTTEHRPLRPLPSKLTALPHPSASFHSGDDRSSAATERPCKSDASAIQINRLRESCALFKTIVNSKWFRNTSVILFLNKTDILEEKIQHSSLSQHFPEFEGPVKNSSAAKEFILNKYTKSFDRLKHTKRTMYVHYTCATDTDNIKFVFAAVKDIIVQSYLINYNLVWCEKRFSNRIFNNDPVFYLYPSISYNMIRIFSHATCHDQHHSSTCLKRHSINFFAFQMSEKHWIV